MLNDILRHAVQPVHDFQRPHIREIEHDPPVGDAVTGITVATAAADISL